MSTFPQKKLKPESERTTKLPEKQINPSFRLRIQTKKDLRKSWRPKQQGKTTRVRLLHLPLTSPAPALIRTRRLSPSPLLLLLWQNESSVLLLGTLALALLRRVSYVDRLS